MAELKLNPNYKPELGATPANQQYVFSDPNQIINPQTGQTAITAASLEPVKPIEIPKVPTDNTNYAGIITGGASEVDMIAKQMADRAAEVKAEAEARAKEQGGIDIEALLKKYGGQAPPSGADIYQSTYGVGSTQAEVSALEQNKITTAGIVKSAQNEFNAINAQIQSINLASQARNLQLEKQISGGGTLTAGSGEVLSRQQTESNRQAAIESLPLQGQALVAQAKILVAQNDAETASQILNLAKQKMDTLFNLKITDAQNLYNYNKEIRNRVWDYLTEKEKTQLAALQKEDDRKYQEQKDNLTQAQLLSVKAMEAGQADIAGKITQLDPKSPTFLADLAKLQAQIKIQSPEVKSLMTKYPDAGILPTDDYTTASAKLKNSRIYQEQVRPPVGAGGDIKPLDILDIQRYQEAYPNAGIVAGDTEAIANAKALRTTQPQDLNDTDLRKIANANKNAKTSYEEAIAGIDADITIKNKDRAKFITAEIYGKAGGKTFDEWMGKKTSITPQNNSQLIPAGNGMYWTPDGLLIHESQISEWKNKMKDDIEKELFSRR